MLGFLHVIAIEVFLTLCFFSGHVHTLCFKISLFERLDGQIMIERASQKGYLLNTRTFYILLARASSTGEVRENSQTEARTKSWTVTYIGRRPPPGVPLRVAGPEVLRRACGLLRVARGRSDRGLAPDHGLDVDF